MMGRTYVALAFIGIFQIASQSALAYDVLTHSNLGLLAVQSSARFDVVLREDLGYADGADTRFVAHTATNRIRLGASLEDNPLFRVVYHFHNPLRLWSTAGLRMGDIGLPFSSSVTWSQQGQQSDPTSDLTLGGGTWSWPFARHLYLKALSDADPPAREEAMAKMLRAIGHLIHLVQDATVPAHARNDPHLTLGLFGLSTGDPDPYEGWVQHNGILPLDPVFPDTSVFRPTFDSAAPAPVAGLIDTKTFLGANPGRPRHHRHRRG